MTMQIVVLLIQEPNPVIFLSVAHCIMCNSPPDKKDKKYTTQFREYLLPNSEIANYPQIQVVKNYLSRGSLFQVVFNT